MSERIAPGSVNLLVQRLLPGGNPPAAANSALNSLKVPIIYIFAGDPKFIYLIVVGPAQLRSGCIRRRGRCSSRDWAAGVAITVAARGD